MTIKLPPLPEPDYWSTRDDDTPLFTADQLRTAQREVALMALDEAAKAAVNAASSPSSLWHPGCWAHASEYLVAQLGALRTELEVM